MSEHITHVALCDDGRRLAAVTPEIPAALNEAWAANPEMGRAGGITRFADRFSAEIIAKSRDEAATDEDAGAKLAFVLGALTHRAADRLMKPVFAYFRQQDDYDGVNRATMHCDVFMLKHVIKVFPASMFAGDETPEQARLDEVVWASLGRALVNLHTIIPDVDDIDGWLSRLKGVTQEQRMRMDVYREMFNADDPAAHERYIVQTHFYDADDPIVQVAATLREGGSVSGADLDAAVAATTQDSSRYARALAQANGYLRAAGALYEGRATIEETKPKLDIGVPELSVPFEPKGG